MLSILPHGLENPILIYIALWGLQERVWSPQVPASSFFSGAFTVAQRFPQSSSLFNETGPEGVQGGEGVF